MQKESIGIHTCSVTLSESMSHLAFSRKAPSIERIPSSYIKNSAHIQASYRFLQSVPSNPAASEDPIRIAQRGSARNCSRRKYPLKETWCGGPAFGGSFCRVLSQHNAAFHIPLRKESMQNVVFVRRHNELVNWQAHFLSMA
jgi:hypothetical protein